MLLWAGCLLIAVAGAPPEGVVLQDGQEIEAPIRGIRDGALVLEGHEDPIPLYELLLLRLGAPAAAGEAGPSEEGPREAPASGPLVRFRDGATLFGRVLIAGERTAEVEVSPPAAAGSDLPPLRLTIPLEGITGFRLREPIRGDAAFEDDLASPPSELPSLPGGASAGSERSSPEVGSPAAAVRPLDSVYVRRSSGALRVEGAFESLDAEYLTMRFEDRSRRIRRELVQGVILAPVASHRAETEIPAAATLLDAGTLPCFLESLRGERPNREIVVRFQGAADDDVHAIHEGWIREIRLSSDRVLFLSSIRPVYEEETPLIGAVTTFPYRQDRAASGGPLRMGGRTYRKGIGVHPRSILEYDIGGRYASLAGLLGLDDSSAATSGVTFRILADGKEIYTKPMKSGDAPESLSIPVAGVRRLRLVVDFGEDGVDFGDYANWAELRVTQ